jgi:hypothetical protein
VPPGAFPRGFPFRRDATVGVVLMRLIDATGHGRWDGAGFVLGLLG